MELIDELGLVENAGKVGAYLNAGLRDALAESPPCRRGAR